MKKIILILIFIAFLNFDCTAQEYEYEFNSNSSDYDSVYDASGFAEYKEKVPDSITEFLEDIGIDVSDVTSFNKLFSKEGASALFSYLFSNITAPISGIAVIISAIIVCSLCESISISSESGALVRLLASLCVCSAIVLPVANLIFVCCNELCSISDLMLAFVPVFAAVLIATLKTQSASAFQGAMFISSQIISYFCGYIIPPFCSSYLALATAISVSNQVRLVAFCEQIKKCAIWIINAAMTLFCAIVSVQNLIASQSDTVASKTVKYVVGTSIPIVGGALSDLMNSTGSCISIIKTSFGIYAIIAVIIILLPNLISVLLYKFTLSMCGNVCALFSQNDILRLLNSVNSALSIILAVLCCSGVMLIFSTASILVLVQN